MKRLFSLVLPRDGYRACAVQWRPKDSDAPALFTRLFETDGQLAAFLERKGRDADVWFSTASFRDVGEAADYGGFKGYRGASNLHARQSFHGDVDCGEDRPYPRFEWAQAALGLAVARLGLPKPIVVRSGHGLHLYWPLDVPIADVRLWRAYAEGLAAALAGQGLKLDAQCSVDPVRLLRSPGTWNHKGGGRLPVTVEDWGDGSVPIGAFDQFKAKKKRARKIEGRDATPIPLAEFPTILRRCRQLNNFAKTQGCVSEPIWKACIGVLAFVEGGREIAHAYSSGDGRYDQEETDAKFYERVKLSGPTTCKYFRVVGGDICNTCTWRTALLATPLQLARLP